MKCPMCNTVFDGKICPECGVDITLYKKICKISARLYNNGLEKVMSGDFYNAEAILNKSVLFNKGNIDARNLLGLVCYETGKVGLALKHWVISYNMKKEDNPAGEYIDDFQANPKSIEKFNDSIKYYNQGLKSLQQDSEDIAIIHLKKAVDINPSFVDAFNLLSLAYIMQKKESKAIDIIKTVLKLDVLNPTAMTYFKYLNPDKSRLDNEIKSMSKIRTSSITSTVDKTSSIGGKNSFKNSKFSKWIEILAFLFGCVCTAAVMFVLVIPSQVQEGEHMIEQVNVEIAELKQKYEVESASSSQEIENLKKENASLKKQNDEFNSQINTQNIISKVDNASALSETGDNAQAATVLASIDTSVLPADKLEQFNSIKQKVYTAESKRLLNEGVKLVTSKKYDEAKTILESCLNYSQDIDANKYSAMYYLGKALKETGDTEKAKEYLNQVVSGHPQKKFQSWAKGELASL